MHSPWILNTAPALLASPGDGPSWYLEDGSVRLAAERRHYLGGAPSPCAPETDRIDNVVMLWVVAVIVIVVIVVATARRARAQRPPDTPQSSVDFASPQPTEPNGEPGRLGQNHGADFFDAVTPEPEPGPGPAVSSTWSAAFKMPDRGRIWRQDYAPSEMEPRYVVRAEDGLPALRLVDAGDRLAIWSPADGGVLINPKGAGLRKIGLYSSYARGSQYASASACRGAPRRAGIIVELRRDPTNEHDPNAVGMIGNRGRFAWVQRGRAAAVARRIDAGDDLAAVSLREGLFLIGARSDLQHMLT